MADRTQYSENSLHQRSSGTADAASFLRGHKKEIIQTWEKRAREEIRAAEGKESTVMQDSLPLFLDQLIASLETLSPSLVCAQDIAKTHAVQRSEFTDFDLEQIMVEYNVLRQVIFQICDDADFVPSFRERNIILDFIQNGKVAAANRFTQLAVDQTKKSEKRFRALFDLSVMGIAVTDPVEERFVQANRKFAEMLGFTEQELRGKTIAEVTHPEDIPKQRKTYLHSVQEKKREWKLQKRYIRKDGSVFWAELWVTLLRDEAGEPELVLASVIDITQRKNTDEERHRLLQSESEAKTHAENVIHRLHHLMMITETELSQKKTLDEVLNRALDYIHDTFEADTVAIFMSNETKEYLEVRAASGLEEELVRKVQIQIGKGVAGRIMKEGHPIIVNDLTDVEVASPVIKQKNLRCLMGVPLRTKQEVIGVIHVGRLKSKPFQKDELEFLQIVADRLAISIDNSTLYFRLQSKLQELQTERELRERFVATVAHDLRNPLSAAKLSTQLVLRYPDRVDARERQLGKIIHNLERADHLIQNLLDANRIRAGQRLPLELDECDISLIAREVCEEQSMIHGDRFIVDAPETFAGYWSCSGIRRILENLITNGMKYGSQNTAVTVRIAQKNDHAWISVHNEGPPIPLSEQKTLFDPFRRAKSAQEKGTPGWGLGLTLVRGLTEAHGGTVSIESTAEAGTTFKVDLPMDARPYQVVKT
jgi:PAS domain S-box-containing protein